VRYLSSFKQKEREERRRGIMITQKGDRKGTRE
jgi:hypothetical protein